MNLSTKQEQTHRLGEQIYSYQGQKVGWKGRLGVWDGHVRVYMLYLTWITNKDLLCGTESSSQYSVMAYIGKESLKKKKWTYVYVQLIHFAVHLKLIPHC